MISLMVIRPCEGTKQQQQQQQLIEDRQNFS
jgi:hypothetical protein